MFVKPCTSKLFQLEEENVLTKYKSFTCSENGWTDGKIGYKWLTEVFDPETKQKANGRTQVLIDGSSLMATAPTTHLSS